MITYRCTKCMNKLTVKMKNGIFTCKKCGKHNPEPKISYTEHLGHKRKRKVQDGDLWSYHKIVKALDTLYHAKGKLPTKRVLRNCALISILFLTGSRVSEILGVKNKKGDYIVKPLIRKQFGIVEKRGTKLYYFNKIPVLKKKESQKESVDMQGKPIRSIKRRTVLMPYGPDASLLSYVEKYVTHCVKSEDEFLFNIHGNTARYILFRNLGQTFPHFLRHCRASDLGLRFGLSQIPLKNWFDWSKAETAERYTHVTEEDLLHLIMRNIEK